MRVFARAGLPAGRWRGRAVLSFRRTVWFEGEDQALLGLFSPGLSPSPAGFELAGPLPTLRTGLSLESDGERWHLEGWGELEGVASAPDSTAHLPAPHLGAEENAVPEASWAAAWDAWFLAVLPDSFEGAWLWRLSRGPVDLWESLIGWGSGSTPLADDYLAGWLSARWSRGADLESDSVRLKHHLHRTSRLSRHYLRHLAEGRIDSALADFLKTHPRPLPSAETSLALAARGDLSGRATLVGLVAGLRGDL